MDWQSGKIEQPLAVIQWNLLRYPPTQRDDGAVAMAVQAIGRLFSILDEHLRIRAYVAGDSFTVGDIPLGVMAYRWFNLPVERPPAPHIWRWYERLSARPAFRSYVMLPLS